MSKGSEVRGIDIAALPGVATNAPPADVFRQIGPEIDKFVSTLAPDQRGGLLGIATRKGDRTSVNLAVVQRIGEHGAVVTWIGKSWGEPVESGIGWKQTW